MEVDQVKIKIPKKKEKIEKFYNNCEKRKKFINDPENHYKKRLKKSKHDLSRAISEFDQKCWDWTITKAYYAIHHAGNALFSKRRGKYSKDHSCLIVALKHLNLIDDNLFKDLAKIHERFSDVFSLDITFQLRKISQYDVDEWESLTREDARTVLNVAEKFVKHAEDN